MCWGGIWPVWCRPVGHCVFKDPWPMVECSADCSSYPPPPSLHISPHISLSFSVFLSFKYLLHQLLQLMMHLLGFTPNHWYTLLTNYVCKWQNNHNKTSKPRHLCLIINSNCDRSISNEFSSRHLKCDHPTCPATCPHVSDTAMTRQIVSPPRPPRLVASPTYKHDHDDTQSTLNPVGITFLSLH